MPTDKSGSPWWKVRAVLATTCVAFTACVFFWYLKFIMRGEAAAYPEFIFAVTAIIAIEFVLFLGFFANPIYPLIAIHLWPIIFVIGSGTAIAVVVQVLLGAAEWLAKGETSYSRFADYLDFLDIRLSETTIYIGWNKIAYFINNMPIILGELGVVVLCFVLFFLMFFLIDKGGDRENMVYSKNL